MLNRENLDDIIMKNDTDDWWQPELFRKNTKHLLPPELEIVADPPVESLNHNCFIYTFGFGSNSSILKETNGFIYDSFIKKLMELGELIKTEDPQDGDFVVYQDLENYPDSLTHIGTLVDGKVISKWAWGPVVKHALWDVPKDYGDNVFYLRAIDKSTARELYAQHKEHNVKPIF